MYFSDKNLASLIPWAKLKSRNVDWGQRVRGQYKEFSTFMAGKENKSTEVSGATYKTHKEL